MGEQRRWQRKHLGGGYAVENKTDSQNKKALHGKEQMNVANRRWKQESRGGTCIQYNDFIVQAK